MPHCRIYITQADTALPAEVNWFSQLHMLLFGEKCGQMLDWCCFYDEGQVIPAESCHWLQECGLLWNTYMSKLNSEMMFFPSTSVLK